MYFVQNEEKLENLRQSIATSVNTLCKCDFSPLDISQGEFSCRLGKSDSVIYRARISGTADRSASDMAALVQSWVESDTASVLIENSRLQIDPSCNTRLDNIRGPDCDANKPPIEPTSPDNTKSTTTPDSAKSSSQNDDNNNVSTAQVLGIFIGGAAIGLFLTLFVLLFIATLFWCKKKTK